MQSAEGGISGASSSLRRLNPVCERSYVYRTLLGEVHEGLSHSTHLVGGIRCGLVLWSSMDKLEVQLTSGHGPDGLLLGRMDVNVHHQ